MGCSNCSSGGGIPNGCKSNGACGTYGCNKLDVFDWMAGMEIPDGSRPFDIAEVRFKQTRKGFYRIPQNIEVYNGDVVVVDVGPGFDVGVVSLTGELVRTQMRKREVKDNYEVKKILRKANEADIQKWQEARSMEQSTMMRARMIAKNLRLDMKISDVEYQGDKTKATFFYTADDRVDFRELIKRYADEFRIRVDMRQIGYRLEAARVGGIGSCGRELCCSSWLTDFRAVSTGAARYQQLSINPAKLAGQCGKLKCCLNYELDQYVEALKEIPSVHTKLHLPKGPAYHFKTDIFQRLMYFVYEQHAADGPFPLSVDAVKEIMEKNKRGVSIDSMESFVPATDKMPETDFAEVVGQDSLTRFDKRRPNNQRRKNHRSGGGEGRQQANKPQPREAAPTNPSGKEQPRQHSEGENRSRNRRNSPRNNQNRGRSHQNNNSSNNVNPAP